jgi:hypothetical protein
MSCLFYSTIWPHPPSSSPVGEGAALHIFNELRNYHLVATPLLIIVEKSRIIERFDKRGPCVANSPLGGLGAPSISI